MFDCDNKRFINLEPYEIRKAKSTTLNYVAFILKMKGKSVLQSFNLAFETQEDYIKKRAKSNYPPKNLKTIPEKPLSHFGLRALCRVNGFHLQDSLYNCRNAG